ncbi:hypothetical protein RJ639_022601 [Escallonia herrerae]|uniref:Integrase catalytic domain-containing protein n=1 Tax=Escallonia herrerae TaxID=1293975 RepID=A0AA88V1S5_9ASTE|nr:hypothetical protein RJ639_022601 [Escallonia herrerae]
MAPNTSTKYDLEKFNGSNDFSLWRMKMQAVLIQQGLLKTLKWKQGLPDTMSADEKEDMLERAHSEGHYRKDCPGREGKKKDNSNMADAGVGEDNYDGEDVLSVTISSSDGGWIFDTGCSYHMCPNRDWFATYRSFDGGKVLMGNYITGKVVGIGSIEIRMHDGIVRTLTDVRHVPELRKNLISLGTLESNGCSYRDAGGVMRTMKGALVVMKGLKQNSLYLLQGSIVTRAAAIPSSSDIVSDTTKVWHMRLGHTSERGMDVLSKQGVWVYILKKRSDVFVQWKQFKMMIEKQTGKKTKCLRIDNGMELCFDEFREFCKNEGIVRHRTVRKTTQQNGVAEWMSRTLLKRARCMLSNARLSKEYWAEAVNTTAYLVNRSPSTTIDCKTPEKVWFVKHANYENLRIFGCPAYAHVNDGKLEPRAKKRIFLGYANGGKTKVSGRRWLEVRAPDSLPIIPTDKEDGSYSTEENEEPQEQQYNIDRNRLRREIRPPQKYGSVDVVAYALSVAESIELEQLDVKTTFLHGELEEQIFMRQPEGFVIQDVNGLKEQLKRDFEMKDLGAAKTILGMEIQRDRPAGILYLSQKNYVITWKANLQTIVALSTTKAEYIVATKALKGSHLVEGLGWWFGVEAGV